jgi:hypothetical protein
MPTTSSTLRLLAVIMVVIVLATVTSPARAEAADPVVIVGIATLAVAGLILVAYLIIAAASDKGDARLEEPERVVLVQAPQSS